MVERELAVRRADRPHPPQEVAAAHRAAPAARDVADLQRPGRVGMAEHRLDEQQAGPAVQPAQLRPEDRGVARRAQARQRVAPVHDAGIGDRPQRRRVAHAGGQLVRELGHLLGLGGEDERPGRQRGRERAGDERDVALVRERRDGGPAVPGEEGRREHGQRAEEGEAAEPQGDQQHERREHHDQVAQGPRGRPEARVGEGCEQRRHCDDRHRQQPAAPAAAAAPRSDREPHGSGRKEQELGALTAPDPADGALQRPPRGPVRPRGAGVGGLVEQRRHPGREEQRGPAEGEHAVAHQRATVRADGDEREPGQPRGQDEERAPRVRVQRQREEQPEGRHVGAPAQHEGAQEGAAHEHAQQEQERVHPRLVGVEADVGVERHQSGGDEAGPRAEGRHRPPRRRHARDGEGGGERVRRARRRAEERHPDVQQQVVQRRRAVLAQHPRDGAQGVSGDADGDPLVDPVRRREGAQAQRRSEHGKRRDRDRDEPCARRWTPDGHPHLGELPARGHSQLPR